MDIQPFFTEEERKDFFSKYRQLVRSLYSFLQKEDIRKMKELMQRVVALDCYGRDKNGINGLIRNINTALIATTEIGLKRTSVIALLLYRPVLKKVVTLEEVEKTFDTDYPPAIENIRSVCTQYGCQFRELPSPALFLCGRCTGDTDHDCRSSLPDAPG